MLFDLMEQDQRGVEISEIVDFPEITLEMYENGEYRRIVE